MALTTTNYAWEGLTIVPYVKIVSKRVFDGVNDEGQKIYFCAYMVQPYTSDAKAGRMQPQEYMMKDVPETISIADCYADLKSREEYAGWTDA